MKSVLGAVLLGLSAAPAAPAFAGQPQMEVRARATSVRAFASGEDMLMKQIETRALILPNGGITAAVRIATGQSIPLDPVNLDRLPVSRRAKDAVQASLNPITGLKVHPGLVPVKRPASTSRPIRAQAQLNFIKQSAQDWGEGKRTEPVVVERRKKR